MPRKVLVLLAHPMLERSRVNRYLADAAREVEGVLVHDLYEAYPSLTIDVRREQALLEAHDVIVLQHPFYWYSAPPIVKQWQDLVLEHGWAYGKGGTRLDGKVTFNAVSTGGPANAYQPGGSNRFTLRQLLAPFDQTAHLCRMRYLAPFVVYGALRLETEGDLRPHAEAYRSALLALRDDTLDLEAAAAAPTLNALVAARNPSERSAP
jgi:glutathione-regulated potassium-efflux system ancillary protein KefG